MTFREIFYYLDCLRAQAKAVGGGGKAATPEKDDEFGRAAEEFVLAPELSW